MEIDGLRMWLRKAMRVSILLMFLALDALHSQVEEPNLAMVYRQNWHLPYVISKPCQRFHLIKSPGEIFVVCSRPKDEFGDSLEPVDTYIGAIDPPEITQTCPNQNFSAHEVAILGDSKIMMQDDRRILIVDKNGCDPVPVQTKGVVLISDRTSFTLIIRHLSDDKNNPLYPEHLSAEQYYYNGTRIGEPRSIPAQRGKLVYQGQIIDKSSGEPRFFLVYDLSRHSNRWGLADILDRNFRRIDTKKIDPYPIAHSAAHNSFSICYESPILKCLLYDSTFRPFLEVEVTKTSVQDQGNYRYVSVHNLLNGGCIVVFCERILDSDLCRLYYAVIDENGRLLEDHPSIVESSFTDRTDRYPKIEYTKPFLMNYIPFKPVIFEMHAGDGIYCLVFPQKDVTQFIYIEALRSQPNTTLVNSHSQSANSQVSLAQT